ncbi:MAG TPA: SAM-dependent methyltransferase [Bacilli bacterium]|nr:SAM-dependent methyltransferase [Bacilli bacterium]
MNELALWIKERIGEEGPVPFVKFMEWALYHPEWGYYTGERRKFGKEGDFYTSPGVNPVFAEVLADDVVRRLEPKGDWSWIEFGAGDGRLARDVLGWLREKHPATYERLTYRIVEISPTLRKVQRETLGEELAVKVVWQTEEEVRADGPFSGVVVTNELVDAYPVHRVVQEEQGLLELYVDWDAEKERFRETHGSLADERLASYFATYAGGSKLLRGQIAEVGLAGLDWYKQAWELLREGFVITIDYGFEADMLYHPSRKNGTLRGFARHTLTDDPYAAVGEQDLTADVNFTALRLVGEELGAATNFFGSQTKYLVEAGILYRLQDAMHASDPFSDPVLKRNRAIRSLVTPGGLGDQFKVLVQSRTSSV